jgi:hypothetical protein
VKEREGEFADNFITFSKISVATHLNNKNII